MNIMIVAGEASGDMHGARLVEAMWKMQPDLRFSGIGGKELAAAGVELLFDASKIAVVGITEVISHLGDILAARRAIISRMRTDKPALLILIDYPDFNLLLAAKAKKLGIPVFYYISPQVWAWRSGRVKKIGKLTDRVAVILPFEKDFYAERGVIVDFVGHPLSDTVRRDVLRSKEDFFQAHHLVLTPETRIIGILPGSRAKEISTLLPDFLAAAQILTCEDKQKNWLFFLPRASTVSQELLLESGLAAYQDKISIHVFADSRYELMAACDAVVAASGTVTLELALLGIPTVAAYRVSPRTYRLGRLLVRHLRSFSLVNLIGEREIIPELLQDQVTPEAIAVQLRLMLDDANYRNAILRGLAEVAEKLGPPDCSERAANIALSCIR
ncbi:MAG: lipid-A-disaccharide synthase [Candidatus Electronema aureum]|uniref:Lipid-A-disaccharide synthase n=1 Tax=Candidatus Electronema aureum TaxID=2005002 RepID=A0A521G3D7_9BACT|nr:MAG: lipid-A-disaccharide synthase [Candidatus Electronema aureum]